MSGRIFDREIGRLAHARENAQHARHHLAQTHHRRIVEREQALQSRRAHLRAADADDAHVAAGERLQAFDQLAAQGIA